MVLKIYNTASGRKEIFVPRDENLVKIYTCGPTVYWFQHIGNFRTYVVEDILVRLLARDFKIRRVLNITDVGHLTSDADEGEDKMIKAMRREGKSARSIADFYTSGFMQDFKRLRLRLPEEVVRATNCIAEQIALIKRLEVGGFVYRTDDGMYFDTTRFPRYAEFAHLDVEHLRGGERVDLGAKRAVTDFALWKFSPRDQVREMEWESPWGQGFPGWHLECSAILMKYLGDGIDMHCGGKDHIPVHHTNEIAQCEAATGERLANYWVHINFMTMEGVKISKSLGNVITIDDLLEQGFAAVDYKFLILMTHYRSETNFTRRGLVQAQKSLRRVNDFVVSLAQVEGVRAQVDLELVDFENKIWEALGDDLGTAQAVAVIFDLMKRVHVYLQAGHLVKSQAQDIVALLRRVDEVLQVFDFADEVVKIPVQVVQIAQQRLEAREQKDWQTADLGRKKLRELGWEVEDVAGKYTLKKMK